MFKLCDQGFDVEFENGLVVCVRWGVGYSDGVTAVDCYVWSRGSGCCIGKAEKLPSNEVIRFLNETMSLENDNDIVLKLRAERCSKLDMAKAADEIIRLRAMQSAYIETINKLNGAKIEEAAIDSMRIELDEVRKERDEATKLIVSLRSKQDALREVIKKYHTHVVEDVRDIDRLTEERDEARRMYCQHIASETLDPEQQIAKQKGWDCFKNDVVDANTNNQDFRTTDMG